QLLAMSISYEEIKDRDTVVKGDFINLDYEGKIGGEAFDNGTAKGQIIQVGSAGFIAGFEDQLVGKKSKTTFDINVKFPDTYNDPDLAGKDAVFTITINAINKKVEPVLNDEFVQKNSAQSKTVAEFKQEIKKYLQDQKETSALQYKQYMAESMARGNATVSGYPKGMIESMVAEYKETVQKMAKEASKEYKDYIQENFSLAEGEFDDKLKEYMEQTAKLQLIIEAIEKKENLTMSDSEMEEAILKYAKENGLESKEELFKTYKESEVKRYVQQMKVLDFIVNSAKLVEPGSTSSSAASSSAAESGSSAASSSAAETGSSAASSSSAAQ
ncbi:MAG: FKBP-type peptidyl-prolyl cis-trans isomerase, partial [Lachnospiraceae bacterium]|nr:FKBP-type peptidyl-prolyl cis-trans isomerase [Lachnospiraceae bacterium]